MNKQKLPIIIKTSLLILVFLAASGCTSKSTPTSTEAPTEQEAGVEKQEPAAQTVKPEEPKLASRALEFGGTDNKPDFSILSPAGWMKVADEAAKAQQADLLIATITGTDVGAGKTYNTNIMASIGPHQMGEISIQDYVDNWDSVVSQFFPSIEYLNRYQAAVNGMDVYVQNRVIPRDDGVRIRQVQYIFFVDETYVMLVTGSALEDQWSKYEAVIKASIETIEKTSSR